MNAVRYHYENVLARHYTWMLGDDLERTAAQDRQLLEDLGVAPPSHAKAVAVDLGCGPGPQTLALADAGFGAVIGVDTSQQLLDELFEHARTRPAIRPLHLDLVEALPALADGGPIELVVCMRDTVWHLPSKAVVIELCARVAAALACGGAFALTYRDVTRPLEGLDRFIPVRSDPDRVMLCALDYEHPEHVTITDLVYTRAGEEWGLQKSSYRKLRLGPDWLAAQLAAAGLHVAHHRPAAGGMWSTVARRPA